MQKKHPVDRSVMFSSDQHTKQIDKQIEREKNRLDVIEQQVANWNDNAAMSSIKWPCLEIPIPSALAAVQ